MYLTSDASGRRVCLRPDLTIPVARDYLAPSPAPPARRRAFATSARCFANGARPPGEFLQARASSRSGRRDTAAADAEVLSPRPWKPPRITASTRPKSRIGDVALFGALVAALDLAPAWKRRLVKDFNRKTNLAQDLDRLVVGGNNTRPEYQGVLAALAGSDPKGAHALVTDLLSIAGITAVGGRSVGEIADRFLEQSALGASARLPREVRGLIERFLGINGDPDEAAAELRALANEANVALAPALDLFESRTGFLAARGIDLKRVRFSTAFGRGFDYYTGFVFELTDPKRTGDPLVAGGRYDGLLTRLGSPDAIPAIGLAVWIERLSRLRRRAMSAVVAGPLQRPVAGKRGKLFRPRSGLFDQAARRARLSRRHCRSRRRRGGLFVGGRNHRPACRPARCISASPARIWCAR